MNIVVFGATGMIGTRIAAELEQHAHAVTAATRATGADVTDPQSVASIAAGDDAVVSAVSARGVSYTLADVAPPLVDGLREAGVRRLLVVGDQLLVDDNGNSEVSAEDYAIAIADLLEQGGHERERITVAW